MEQLIDFLEVRFSEVNLVEMAKHKLYHLYQINKDLEMFLNIFMQLQKKAKINDSQVLDMLNKNLSNEFKDRFVIVKKADNLNNFITFLWDIDANIKKINKQSHFRAKQNTFAASTMKSLFKMANSAFVK